MVSCIVLVPVGPVGLGMSASPHAQYAPHVNLVTLRTFTHSFVTSGTRVDWTNSSKRCTHRVIVSDRPLASVDCDASAAREHCLTGEPSSSHAASQCGATRRRSAHAASSSHSGT